MGLRVRRNDHDLAKWDFGSDESTNDLAKWDFESSESTDDFAKWDFGFQICSPLFKTTSPNGISVFRFGRQLANGLGRSDYGSSEPVALPNQIGKLKKKNASYYLKGYYSSLPRQDSP